MFVDSLCNTCGKAFQANSSELVRGNARFCSRECGRKSDKRPTLVPNVVCAACNKLVHKAPSKLKNSKSGLYFCGRACKEKSQRIGGIAAIQPSHYKTGISVYHRNAIDAFGNACQRCGYNKYPICDVHHKDRNRHNNALENLEVLCSRCHDEEHYLARDGKFST